MPKGKKNTAPPPKGGVARSLKTRMFGQADAPQTAQQSIPFREMYKDGVCRVTGRLYTKTIAFGDINYQLSQNEDKNAIFESYCDFLNYFDSSIHVQLTFINKRVNIRDFERSIEIPGRSDAFNDIRREYTDMLRSQLAKGRKVWFGRSISPSESRPLRSKRPNPALNASRRISSLTSRRWARRHTRCRALSVWMCCTASFTRTGSRNCGLTGRISQRPACR